jgi:hypothetical protein
MIHIFFEAHRFPNLAALTVKNIKTFEVKFTLRLGVSICLDVVSIETLDLDTEKKSVSTVEKISTV